MSQNKEKRRQRKYNGTSTQSYKAHKLVEAVFLTVMLQCLSFRELLRRKSVLFMTCVVYSIIVLANTHMGVQSTNISKEGSRVQRVSCLEDYWRQKCEEEYSRIEREPLQTVARHLKDNAHHESD